MKCSQTMEYQSASQKDEIQTRVSTWTSLEDTMPSEGKWLQKSTQYVTPLTCRAMVVRFMGLQPGVVHGYSPAGRLGTQGQPGLLSML